jgi:2-polyprenyl-3-methyl-5-hydroxy-6-metoxy-1,4-benzoquinol methylase
MNLDQSEREKYERIWAHDAYRKGAPGERCVDEAIRRLRMEPGDTVIDFGCGTGRPAQALQAAGMNVMAVDFAANCLDPNVNLPFRQACLWDIPDDLIATYGFCTDVMEHIPTDRVNDVLNNIAHATTGGVYFQIATRPDRMGRLIGQTLHLTVRDADWWADRLRRFWPNVRADVARGGMVAVVTP